MTALLIILAIIAVILLIPFGANVRYSQEELSVAVRVALFDIGIIPGREKPDKKEKPPKKEKKKKEKAEGPKKKPSFTKDELLDLAALLLDTLSRFRRKLVVNSFTLHYVSADKNPYEAATRYGYVNSVLGMLAGPASNAFNVLKSDVRTAVDFEITAPVIDLAVTLTFNLAKLLGIAFAAAFGFMRIRIRAIKEKSRDESAEERMDKDGTAALPDGRADAGQHG